MCDSNQSRELDCYIKELELLQSEMDQRLARQANSFYISATIIAAVIAGIAIILAKPENSSSPLAINQPWIYVVLLVFPCLIMPLAGLFFDDDMVRGVTVLHIHDRIIPGIRSCLKKLQGKEPPVFYGTISDRFRFLKRLRIPCPRMASHVRRFLFALPFFVAVLSFVGFLINVPSKPAQLWFTMLVLAVVDVVLAVLLVWMWLNAERTWSITHKHFRRNKDNVSEKSSGTDDASLRQAQSVV
jgi:TRAP-type C4-dicarboxylate transport system permease small subunit